MDLITATQYQLIIPSPVLTATETTWLTNILIPGASLAISRFCDRQLASGTVREWVSSPGSNGVFFPQETPFGALYAALRADDALQVVNNGSGSLILVATADTFTVYNPVANTSKAYLLATCTTLAALTAAVAVDYPALAFTALVDSGTASVFLVPASVNVPAGGTVNLRAACVPVNAQVSQDGGILFGDSPTSGAFTSLGGYEGCRDGQTTAPNGVLLVYLAGYNPVPMDLQIIAANVVRDMMRVQKNRVATGLLRESVSEHSYELLSGVSFDDIVRTKYAGALSPFRRITF